MLLLDRQSGATAQPREEANRPNVPTGRVQLRMRANGQVLELPPGKTTIGSSPRCNVRIEKPGVQPLHCLIVEGAEGLRVRSWVANTMLNGVPFEESALAVGDCLSLGTVELEVVDPLAKKPQVKAVDASVVKSKDTEIVRAGRDQARIRSRRLLDTLRQERSTHQELCQQVAKLQESHLDAIAEQNEISSKLESSLAELATARRQLGDYQAVETARQQLAERNEQLGFEIGELSAQINELKQRQAEVEAERQASADNIAALEEQHRQLVECNSRLQSEAAQVADEKAAAQEQYQQFVEERNQLQGQVGRLTDEKNAISEQYQLLIEANARLQIEVGQLANEKGSADEQCQRLVGEKSQLQSEFDRLAEEKNATHEQYGQLVETNSGLQNQLGQLANEKEAADEQCRRLADEKSQLQGEFDRLAGEKNAIHEQHRQLAEASSSLQSQLGQLANEKATANEQCRQLTEQKSQLQGEFDRLAAEKNATNEQYRQLFETNSELQNQVGQLANEKAAADEQFRQLTEQKSQLQCEFDRVADEKKTLGEVNSRLQDDVVQLANEKAAADDHNRQLVHQMSQLTHEVGHLTEQKDELEAEREGLRHQNEQLLSEARELAGERGTLADERTALCQERSELRQQNELLRTRIAQLNDENSAMAVGKLTLVEQRDSFSREAEELRVRVAQLSEENATLAAAKATLADEQSRLVAEQKRLTELEREMGAAVAGRENTSAELYNALLQLAEMQERDGQNKAVIEAYESLSKEHDLLHSEADRIKEQNQRLSEERAAVEGAWQALSAEAATLGESQQRTADENATLVASLDEMRQQLEQAEQERATLAIAAAELERERAAKLQAEADVAAAIADGERRLAEQEHRFAEQAQQFAEQSSEFNARSRQQAEQAHELAEAINRLERQLAVASESRESLARAREAVQLELANAEARRGEQSRRIQELESQLAAAEERASQAAVLAASRFEANRKSAVVEPVLGTPERAETASRVAAEEPAEFRWSSNRGESAPLDELNAVGADDNTSLKSLDQSSANKPAWHLTGAEVSTDDASAEAAVYAWSDASEPSAAAKEPNPWSEKISPPAPVDASAFGEDEGVSLIELPAEDSASTEKRSVWNQAAEQLEIANDGPDFSKPEESVQQAVKPESSPKPKLEPVSYIERYSHLLVEDGAAAEQKPARLNESAPARPLANAVVRPAEPALPPKSEEEDSIEQYMAKLLQRVRGDSDGGKAAREQPSRMPLNAPTSKPAGRPVEHSAPSAMTAPQSNSDGEANANDAQAADRSDWLKRKATSPAPATNLGALRALANETARLAISRHELRKLRRNAVTKVIVSTLAGVTSLWLMLDSPDWLNVQFITACVALIVAAYWAGETFRTLVFSMRIAANEGPEETAVVSPGLPIDVEQKS